MAWQTPKTNWKAGDVPAASDFNRIEGNTKEVKDAVDSVDGEVDAHKSEEATDTKLGHIRLSDIAITDPATGDKYKWGVEDGRLYLEKVV